MSAAIDVTATSTVASNSRTARLRTLLETVVPLIALAALIIYFSVATPYFLRTSNLQAITQVAGPLLLVSMGATFVIVMGSIDLSVGSVALLAGSVCALLLANNLGMKTIPIAVLVGAGCGLLSGTAFAYGRVPSFIVTLGALSVFRGLGLRMISGSPVPFTDAGFSNLANGQFLPNIADVTLWAVVLWLLAVYVTFRTKFGRYIYAIGGNERVARLSGIPVDRYKVYAFILSGITAALAGMFSVGQLGSADPTLGSTFLLDSLAAIVVGGTALSGGVGGVHRTMLGVLIISILDDGLNLMGVDEFTQEIIKGAVIVVAAAVVMLAVRKTVVK